MHPYPLSNEITMSIQQGTVIFKNVISYKLLTSLDFAHAMKSKLKFEKCSRLNEDHVSVH